MYRAFLLIVGVLLTVIGFWAGNWVYAVNESLAKNEQVKGSMTVEIALLQQQVRHLGEMQREIKGDLKEIKELLLITIATVPTVKGKENNHAKLF